MENRHMHEEKDPWKGLLAKQFDQFEEDPEKELWTAISQEIPQKKKIHPLYMGLPLGLAASLLIWFFFLPSGDLLTPTTEQIRPSGKMISSDAQLAYQDQQHTVEEKQQEKQSVENELVKPEKVSNTLSSSRSEVIAPPATSDKAGSMDKLLAALEPETLKETKESIALIQEIEEEEIQASAFIPEIILPETEALMAVEKAVSTTKKVDLGNLKLDEVIVFASNQLNKKTENSPVKAVKETDPEKGKSTFTFKLGNFSIVKKKYTKSAKSGKI